MIKNRLKKTLISIVLVGTSLMAENSESAYATTSLLGIEGGYSSLGYENSTSASNKDYNAGLANIGLKIGAETKDFRVFLSGRYFNDTDDSFSYITTYGGEIQYKFNVSKKFNLFIGVNGGIASMKFKAPAETASRTISDPYLGGDLGLNIHFGDSTDLEFGGKIMSIQATNTKNNVSYLMGNMVTGYASLIYKWKMD